MSRLRTAFAAAALSLGSLVAPTFTAAHAAVDDQQPGPFVDTLSEQAFSALRTGNKSAARSQFRTLLGRDLRQPALDQAIADLVHREILGEQRAAYKAAFPTFIIGTYADRLFDYAHATVKVVRTVPQGDSAAVMTQVVNPGSNPVTAIWTVERVGGGYKVTNLTVAGINLAMTQAADFNSYIQKNGFDKLVSFMKSRG